MKNIPLNIRLTQATSIFLLLCFLIISGCKKEETPPVDNDTNNGSTSSQPTITQTYYIRAKFSGTDWKLNQTNAQIGCQSSDAICWQNVNGSFFDVVGFDIFTGGTSPSATYINSLQGETFSFDQNDSRYAHFYWGESSSSLSSSHITDQTGSTLTITSIEPDGTFSGKQSFKVQGTFNCKVASSDTSSEVAVSQGEFSIRVTEGV